MQGPAIQLGSPPAEPSCELCGRCGLKLTKHHLIPRKRHRQTSVRRKYSRQDRHTRIALLCRPCHSTVHAHLSEKELEQAYNTVPALAGHAEIARFVDWVKRQPVDRRVAIKRPNR